jgi:hypothetical protein
MRTVGSRLFPNARNTFTGFDIVFLGEKRFLWFAGKWNSRAERRI